MISLENHWLKQPEKSGSKEEAIVIKAHGDINAALDQFRDLLGGGQPNTVPGAVGGRREINWDAVPANLTNNNSFPGDFFGSSDPAAANGRKRGLISTTPGTGFSISDTNFALINPNMAISSRPSAHARHLSLSAALLPIIFSKSLVRIPTPPFRVLE